MADKSEEEYLLELWNRNICPHCGRTVALGGRVGSGKKRQGGFCSLDCYTRYYQFELSERAKRIAEICATA